MIQKRSLFDDLKNIEKPVAIEKPDITPLNLNREMSDEDYAKNLDVEYITNALGEVVPVLKTYEGDYMGGTRTNAKLAKENIEIKNDHNIKEFIKYNKSEKMGYLVYYNTSTKGEVKKG